MVARGRAFQVVAVSIVSVGLITLVKLAVWPIHPAHSFLLYFFAIVTSAWFGGRYGGFLATALIVASVPWLAGRHTGPLNQEMMIRIFIFVVESIVITLIIDALLRERARLERARASEQAARRDAEEATRSHDRFVNVISHELRAPLTAIMGWTQLLLAGRGAEALQQQALTAIEENARAQARLLDDLLDYARLSTGRVQLERKPVRVCDVVRSAVDAFAPEAQQKRLELRNAVNGLDAVVDGEEGRLRQVFLNIIQNAVRYTDEGRIDVCAEVSAGHVRVSVVDTGRGIAPEFLPKIFERFTQETAGAARQTAGVGLGLAIVRELVALHGGSIVASSEGPGKGSCFTIELPLTA